MLSDTRTIMAGQMDVGAILGEQLLNAAKIMEEQVDQEIANLEKLDEDDLEVLRRKRMGRENSIFTLKEIIS